MVKKKDEQFFQNGSKMMKNCGKNDEKWRKMGKNGGKWRKMGKN